MLMFLTRMVSSLSGQKTGRFFTFNSASLGAQPHAWILTFFIKGAYLEPTE